MTIDDAIKQLESIKKSHGNINLVSYVQTGADSYRWQNLTHLVPVFHGHKAVVQVTIQ